MVTVWTCEHSGACFLLGSLCTYSIHPSVMMSPQPCCWKIPQQMMLPPPCFPSASQWAEASFLQTKCLDLFRQETQWKACGEDVEVGVCLGFYYKHLTERVFLRPTAGSDFSQEAIWSSGGWTLSSWSPHITRKSVSRTVWWNIIFHSASWSNKYKYIVTETELFCSVPYQFILHWITPQCGWRSRWTF